mgnify:CR=1 FL=1
MSGEEIGLATIRMCGQDTDFGRNMLFNIGGVKFGVEICEDMWVPAAPSLHQAVDGAQILFNLSASPEAVGKHAYLRQLVAQQSARTIGGYVYCSAGFGESSTDLVFAGNGIIAENGKILREAKRFVLEEQLVVADLDIERLEFERLRNTSFRVNEGAAENTVIEMEIPEGLRAAALDREIDAFLDVKQEIRQTIALVADADCRLLLELRYLSMKRWEDIAGEMQMCRTSVYLLHRRALDMVETILRTREECARHDG